MSTDDFVGLVTRFDEGLLVSRREQGELRVARAVIAAAEPVSTLWLIVVRHHGRPLEVAAGEQLALTLQTRGRAMSCRGQMTVVDQPDRLRSLWREAFTAWFPKGLEDPRLTLVRFRVEDAESWDERGPGPVRFIMRRVDSRVVPERRGVSQSLAHALEKLS